MRDWVAKYRENDIWSRLAVGVASGGAAALISCPAEVSLVCHFPLTAHSLAHAPGPHVQRQIVTFGSTKVKLLQPFTRIRDLAHFGTNSFQELQLGS